MQFHVDELVPHQLLVDIRRIVLRSSSYECQSSWQIWVERKTKLHNFDALLDSRQILQTKILDDVFSELDENRARRLVECLPDSQIILTSATGTVPEGIEPGQTLEVIEGQIHGC